MTFNNKLGFFVHLEDDKKKKKMTWEQYGKQACPVWCVRDLGCGRLEGEHRTMKQTCHFDYGGKTLWQTYIHAAGTLLWLVGGRRLINKALKLQELNLTLKHISILIWTLWVSVCFLVEALWLVTRAQICLEGLKYPLLRCFSLIGTQNGIYLRARDILVVNVSKAQLNQPEPCPLSR